jgi:hypothetical protein
VGVWYFFPSRHATLFRLPRSDGLMPTIGYVGVWDFVIEDFVIEYVGVWDFNGR